jgi:phage terminase large subunit
MNLKVTPVFTRSFHSRKRIVVHRGGSRSSKTYSLAQQFVLWLMTGQITKDLNIPVGVASIVRKYSKTLSKTVMRDFEMVLDNHNLWDKIKHNLTNKTYEYNGRMVEFIGADDQQKLRGSRRNILWCNEANELGYNSEFFQLLIRTEDKVFIDFNPDDENIWINTELEQKRYFDKQDVDVIVSSYLDNTFLPASLIDEIEYLKQTDEQFWVVYGTGQYGKLTGRIFSNWEVVDNVPDGAKLLGYGVDFGFTNDPSSIIALYQQDGQLWVDEILYNRGMTNSDLCNYMNKKGIDYYANIVADSAEPKSIEEIYRYGFKGVTACVKGRDSINIGIDLMKQYKINITCGSENLIKEFKGYKWKQDKNGNTMNVPIDYLNHGIDALRYIITNSLTQAKGEYMIV